MVDWFHCVICNIPNINSRGNFGTIEKYDKQIKKDILIVTATEVPNISQSVL